MKFIIFRACSSPGARWSDYEILRSLW